MKVGLLGAGYILDAHAKALLAIPGVEIAAVCDLSRRQAEQAAKRYGINRVTGNIDELLSAVSSVHILLPPQLHEQAARRALEAGKHVFLEKPMGIASASCRELEEIARLRRVELAVNHNFLFVPAWEKLRNDIHSGTIGPIDNLIVNWFYPLALLKSGPFNNWILASPENLVFELFPHLIAFAIDAIGPLEDIRATARRPIDLPAGGMAIRHWNVLASSGPAQIELNLSVTGGAVNRSVLVRGGAATAYCDYDKDIYRKTEPSRHPPIIDDFLSVQRQGWQQILGSTKVIARSIAGTLGKRSYASPYGYSFEKSIGAFYLNIAGGDDRRLSADLGRQTIEACEAIVRSAGIVPLLPKHPRKIAGKPKPSVLVLGGTGFIGRHLLRELARKNIPMRLATRNAGAAQLLLSGQVCEILEGDIGDPEFLAKALEGISTVFHLAKFEGTQWEDYLRGEVQVAKTVGEGCLRADVKRLIYAGTIDSYYSAKPQDTIIGETPVDPRINERNFYARSKAASEQVLMQLHTEQGLPVVIFRPGIVIGEGGPASHWGVGRFWNDAAVDYWGNGRNKLPFILVEDVARALVRGMEVAGVEGRAFLLTDEPLMSARDYVAVLSGILGMRIRSRSKSILRHYLGDVGKELVKHLITHPNRRIPSFRDWSCRAQVARYDSSATCLAMDWQPAGSRDALIERGIKPMAEEMLR
ncbi:MAG TPA: NAD-dependent epimerase/dehydratase family protein [Aestuariivirga sp.]|nr:NAD-dependent epimerase/dehydratase family protein [Aestuariivirga sp.]